ncbi:MAG: peptidylprolyl isomerase [Patescibacteria group bacterium]
MGKFSLFRFRQILENSWAAVAYFSRLVALGYRRVWGWARVRVPMFEALAARHARNPSLMFIDGALVVLTIYLAIGAWGFFAVYIRPSENLATERISRLYPLPAARVNNSFIWADQFLARTRYLNTFNRQAAEGAPKPPTDRELRTQVLNGLVEDRIIYLEARTRTLRVTDDEVEAAFSKQGDSKEIAAKIDQYYGMTIREFKAVIGQKALQEKVKQAVLARIHLRHILTVTLPIAEEVRKQLNEGRPFADLAKEFSQDAQSREVGGDLGFWYRGELASQISEGFEEEVFKLQAEQISAPIQTKFGFHVVLMLERSGESTQTYQQWLQDRRGQYKVKQYIPI